MKDCTQLVKLFNKEGDCAQIAFNTFLSLKEMKKDVVRCLPRIYRKRFRNSRIQVSSMECFDVREDVAIALAVKQTINTETIMHIE